MEPIQISSTRPDRSIGEEYSVMSCIRKNKYHGHTSFKEASSNSCLSKILNKIFSPRVTGGMQV